MARLLSDTRRGREWLTNFDEEEHSTAVRLLNSLTIMKWSEARPGLAALVKTTIRGLREGPVWVLPVLAEEDIAALLDPQPEELIAFETFSPGKVIAALPGSEAAIGNMLRSVIGGRVLAPSTELDKLKSRRVRTILLVTDFIGSGKQVADFIHALLRNKTLKSWKSFGWINVSVVAYVVSPQAQKFLRQHPDVDDLKFVMTEPTIDTRAWTARERDDVKALCRSHCKVKEDALGYRAHGGLFAFQESVPNTLPPILRQKRANWVPFFDKRNMPSDLEAEIPGELVPVVEYSALFTAANQTRLSASINRQMRSKSRQILFVLSHLLVTRGSAASVGVGLGINHNSAESLLSYMVSSGWLESDLSLTESGLAELHAGKRKARTVGAYMREPRDDPYYPSSLRGGDSS